MKTIKATTACTRTPRWAVLQRELIRVMNESIDVYLQKYTRDDGSLIWAETWPDTRDGLDDFYEAFTSFPLFYMLGGRADLLDMSLRAFEAITQQGANMGKYSPVINEYERGYDQFHQSEGYLFFYLLCMADPTNACLQSLARKYAGFFIGEDPNAPNYDPEKNILRAPHNGSQGPRWGYNGSDDTAFHWKATMRRYGLPYDDVAGIATYDDLKDPVLAQRMGDVMEKRMGRGDVANNLLVCGLIANAYFMTGDKKYIEWLTTYVDGWIERARQNGDLLPDNVGLSGDVGEYMGGRWYGSAYGWSWPHGMHNIQTAAVIAGLYSYLLTNDVSYLHLPRKQQQRIYALGKMAHLKPDEMSLSRFAEGYDLTQKTFVIPYRHRDNGWFDYHPPETQHLMAVWNVTQAESDRQVIRELRENSAQDWTVVNPHHNKEDCTNDKAWFAYLEGDNPDYPERTLEAAIEQVLQRVAHIHADDADLTRVHIHHWQEHNPVTTEALIQLTLGAPQIIYYGGTLVSHIRYFDVQGQRSGLPENIVALVKAVSNWQITVQFISLDVAQERVIMIQAGGLGEHQFMRITDQSRTHAIEVNAAHFRVVLPPITEITLTLEIQPYVRSPHYTDARKIGAVAE